MNGIIKYFNFENIAAILFIIMTRIFLLEYFAIKPNPDHLNWTHWQHLPVNMLSENLVRSIINLHSQPPLWNLIIGLNAKACGGSTECVVYDMHLMNFIFTISIFIFMRDTLNLFVRRELFSIIGSVLFCITPSIMFYENYIFYPHMTLFLSTILCWGAAKYIVQSKIYGLITSSICLISLSWIWPVFHPVFVTTIIGLISILSVDKLNKKICFLIIFLTFMVSSVPSFKNLLEFNFFANGSWVGLNLAQVAPKSSEECAFFSFRDKFPKTMHGGEIFNDNSIIPLSKRCRDEAIASILENPGAYLRSIVERSMLTLSNFPSNYYMRPINWGNFPIETTIEPVLDKKGTVNISSLIKRSFAFIETILCMTSLVLLIKYAQSKAERRFFFFCSFYIVSFFLIIHAANGAEQERMRYTVDNVLWLSAIAAISLFTKREYLSRIKDIHIVYSGISFISLVFFWLTANWNQKNLEVYGCDPFGYARQARLFREKGLFEGFGTKISGFEPNLLIKTSQEMNGDIASWYKGIAPHCHHYVKNSDSIILQYPVGTGLILSIFPENSSLPIIMILGTFFCAACLFYCVLKSEQNLIETLIFVIFISLLGYYIYQPTSVSSVSLPLTIFLLPITFILSRQIFSSQQSKSKLIYSLSYGLVLSMLIIIRIPNIFIVCASLLKVIIENRLFSYSEVTKHKNEILVTGVIFCFIIIFLFLVPNYINTNSFFTTTYSGIDATPPALDFDTLQKNFNFYFNETITAPALYLGMASLIYSAIKRKFIPVDGFVAFTLGFVYFISHHVFIEYYMLPTTIYSIICVIFVSFDNRKHSNYKAYFYKYKIICASIATLLIFNIANINPYMHKVSAPLELLSKEKIVWADKTTGIIYYYLNKYAAAISFLANGFENDLIDKLHALGINQIFIIDSLFMSNLIDKIKFKYSIEAIGLIRSNDEYHEVLQLNDLRSNNSQKQISIAEHAYDCGFFKNLQFNTPKTTWANGVMNISFDLVNNNSFNISAMSKENTPIRLSWRFIDKDGKPKSGWEIRKDLMDDILQKRVYSNRIFIPEELCKRDEHVEITLVQENICWSFDNGLQTIKISCNR